MIKAIVVQLECLRSSVVVQAMVEDATMRGYAILIVSVEPRLQCAKVLTWLDNNNVLTSHLSMRGAEMEGLSESQVINKLVSLIDADSYDIRFMLTKKYIDNVV